MSHSSPLSNESPTASNAEADSRQTRDGSLRHTLRTIKAPAQFVSFWAAIALPFAHVTLLAYGLDQQPVAMAFLILVVLNVLTLYVGHGYNQADR